MPRPKAAPQSDTYAGRVAQRLCDLRVKHRYSIEELQQQFKLQGCSIGASTLYAYERGKQNTGVEIPVDLFPIVASIYGYATAHGWLPDK